MPGWARSIPKFARTPMAANHHRRSRLLYSTAARTRAAHRSRGHNNSEPKRNQLRLVVWLKPMRRIIAATLFTVVAVATTARATEIPGPIGAALGPVPIGGGFAVIMIWGESATWSLPNALAVERATAGTKDFEPWGVLSLTGLQAAEPQDAIGPAARSLATKTAHRCGDGCLDSGTWPEFHLSSIRMWSSRIHY